MFSGYPVLTALVSDVVPATGNVAVTLQGTNLFEDTVTHMNEVQVGGVAIDLSTASWDLVTAASVVVIVPEEIFGGLTGVYEVVFSYNQQEYSNTLPLTYTGLFSVFFNDFCTILQCFYTARVVLSSITPEMGYFGGGTHVTIFGTNIPFYGVLTALFDESYVPCTAVTSTSVACVTPSHAIGPVSVSLYVDGYLLSTVASSLTYNYYGILMY